MSSYVIYPLMFLVLIYILSVVVDLFWSLWDECEEDEIHDLEKYRSNDDIN